MKIKEGFINIGRTLRRLPFTIALVLVLLVVGWGTQSYFQELTRGWVSRLGFAPHDFWLLRWERLFLSALVTSGGTIFWFALGMVGITSGVAEWKSGSWRAGLTFWGVHLATLVIESMLFLLPLRQLGFSQARAQFFSRDVGPSAGYMASLGLVTTFLPKPWRWIIFGGIVIYLIIALFLPPRPGETQAVKLAADMAHLIAYPLGTLSASLFKSKR